MSYMAELARIEQEQAQFKRDARSLAEAVMRYLHTLTMGTSAEIGYAVDDMEGEAKNILAKTVGA